MYILVDNPLKPWHHVWLIDWLFNVKQYFSSYLWREQDPAGKWMALGGSGADNLD